MGAAAGSLIRCDTSRVAELSLSQLRDTRKLKEWFAAGETVQLRDRDQVLARIVPERGEKKSKEWPARLKEMWGDRIFDNQEILEEIRGDSAG